MSDHQRLPFARALQAKRGDVVSFVGGGGKTSSMFRLAAELSSAGLRVVTTTTTHISEAQTRIAPTCIGLDALESLGTRLDEFGHCLIVGLPDGKGRVHSVPADLVDSLKNRSDIDVLLVEADGSRSRPFKAPGAHEPVVPKTTTLLVPIAGLNALGTTLDEDHAHRSEIISSLTGQPLGTTITAETIAAILAHPSGGAKQLPPGARLVPLLNRADGDAELSEAREIAAQLISNSTVDRVVISSMIADAPVIECRKPAAGIVLAAGMSTRFGRTKQVLKWGETTLVARTARLALETGFDPVVVVLGFDAALAEKALEGIPVHCVFNPDFASGQSSSIRCGIEALPARTGAAMFFLADQPLVAPPIIRRIVQAHRETLAPACVPVFEGKRGNPVLFDHCLFGELQRLSGDTGGRLLLERYRDTIISIPATREVLIDIDTPADYDALREDFDR